MADYYRRVHNQTGEVREGFFHEVQDLDQRLWTHPEIIAQVHRALNHPGSFAVVPVMPNPTPTVTVVAHVDGRDVYAEFNFHTCQIEFGDYTYPEDLPR